MKRISQHRSSLAGAVSVLPGSNYGTHGQCDLSANAIKRTNKAGAAG